MKHVCARSLRYSRIALTSLVMFQLILGGMLAVPARADEDAPQTTTPIKHVIIIVGENRSFDHVFATYLPKEGQSVDNLLSKGIVKADGTPGPHYSRAHQFSADVTGTTTFQMAPHHKDLYDPMPVPLNGGPTDACATNGICTHDEATSSEDG